MGVSACLQTISVGGPEGTKIHNAEALFTLSKRVKDSSNYEAMAGYISSQGKLSPQTFANSWWDNDVLVITLPIVPLNEQITVDGLDNATVPSGFNGRFYNHAIDSLVSC